mgnify:CR=1 FL=1
MPQMIRDIPGAIITPEHLLLQTIRVGNGDIKKCRIILDKFSEESRRICDVFQNMPQNNRTPLACPPVGERITPVIKIHIRDGRNLLQINRPLRRAVRGNGVMPRLVKLLRKFPAAGAHIQEKTILSVTEDPPDLAPDEDPFTKIKKAVLPLVVRLHLVQAGEVFGKWFCFLDPA